VASGAGSVLGEHEANINAVAIGRDGTRLATGDHDGRILLWNLVDGALTATLPGNGFAVNALAFAADGRLVSASADKTVRVWDVAARQERLRYEGHEDPVVSLALSPDGSFAASATSQGTVDLWELADGAPRRSLYAARGPVWALAVAPDGRTLLSGGADGVVRLWDAQDGHELSGSVPPVSPAPEAATRGDKLFRKCRACHTLTPGDQSKAGPTLFGLFGRRAGSVSGYSYSAALRDSGIVWTPETVDRLFAQGPEAVAPGSKMPLQKMPDDQDRADLIEFLKRATVP
jgi:cytochrome c